VNWTEEEYQAYTQKKSLDVKLEQVKQKANKYNVSAKEDRIYNGIVFDSKAEMKRYIELKALEMAGEIKQLSLQPEYILQESFEHKKKKYREIKYQADFVYIKGKDVIVEDVKGKCTREYLIKKKLLLKRYPTINFVEVS